MLRYGYGGYGLKDGVLGQLRGLYPEIRKHRTKGVAHNSVIEIDCIQFQDPHVFLCVSLIICFLLQPAAGLCRSTEWCGPVHGVPHRVSPVVWHLYVSKSRVCGDY